MSSDQDMIFARIRSALDTLPGRAQYPEWSDALPVSRNIDLTQPLKEQFAKRLVAASGLYFDSVEELAGYLESECYYTGYCDPQFEHLFTDFSGLSMETEFDMARINEYQFGITKASAAIAESGTVVLKDSETSARLGALAPWVHVAVIRESDIVPTPLQAIERFGDDPTVIFCTGPSKTADVEGILIQGVHGPGVQIALVI